MPKLKILALNEAGLNAFQAFIHETRIAEKQGHAQLNPPSDLLRRSDVTKEVGIDQTVETDQIFDTRFDLATYLNTTLDPGFHDRLYLEPGLWAWLALAYFRQLRATKTITQRAEQFIPDEWAKQTPGQDLGYRHSVRTPVQLLRQYGPDFAKFFLTGRPVNEMGDIVEQVVSRPKLLRSEKLRGTMRKLYQAKGGGFKRGAASAPAKTRNSEAGRGGLRRFANVYVPRVKLGYDIDEMEVDDIVEVCGPEISRSRFADG